MSTLIDANQQCFPFPNTDPLTVTIAATGIPESMPAVTKAGTYRITTSAPIQALKDAVPATPSATTASHEFAANQPEYFGLGVGDTVSVVGTIGTVVKLGLMP